MLVINSDGMEIEFSGLSADMLGLASFLNIVENRASMPITINRNEYYPIAIAHFSLNIQPICKLDFQIINNTLHLTASREYLQILSESLINFFDEQTKPHDHFHLYYDEADNNLLHHDTYSLVFIYQ